MKFTIETISKKSGRLGKLLVHKENAEHGHHYKTPVLMQTTKGGSIPYLSADVFSYISKEQQLIQMTLSTMNQMAESLAQWKSDLSSYVGLPGCPSFLLLRDPCETTPSGGNERDFIPLYTRHGKEALTAQRYMEMVSSLAPDAYQGPSDADTDAESSKKRVQKSVDRTERFMEYCYKQQGKIERLAKSTLLVPIVGGYNTYARTQSIRHAREQPAESHAGYVLEGFHTNGVTATSVDSDKLLPVVEHCIKELDEQKPRMMPGAYTPLITLELICMGVDMFDTSYAYLAAVSNKALTFNYDLDNRDAASSPFLDLQNDALKEDFRPLLSNCSCLSCTKHTRAYVHHLYKTNELLGPILLMIHNLHHYMGFFDAIRSRIAADKLSELVQLIKGTAEAPVDYSISEIVKAKSKSDFGKGFVPAAV